MREGSGTKLEWTLTLPMALDQPLLLSGVQLFSCARASSIPHTQAHSSGSQVSTEGLPEEANTNVLSATPHLGSREGHVYVHL